MKPKVEYIVQYRWRGEREQHSYHRTGRRKDAYITMRYGVKNYPMRRFRIIRREITETVIEEVKP